MSELQGKLKRLLQDNPQLGVLVAEILGPPLGLRESTENEEPK